MFNLVSKSTHDAALERAARAEATALRLKRSQGETLSYCAELVAENKALTAKLAVFTAPRKRDARGHFLPAKFATVDGVSAS